MTTNRTDWHDLSYSAIPNPVTFSYFGAGVGPAPTPPTPAENLANAAADVIPVPLGKRLSPYVALAAAALSFVVAAYPAYAVLLPIAGVLGFVAVALRGRK